MRIALLLSAFLILFNGCDERKESPVRGKLTVYVDEGLQNIVTALADSFKGTYKEAEINVVPVKAREGMVKVINKEAELFISTREFNDEELNAVKINKIEYKTVKFCYDGIYAVGDYTNSNDTLSYESVKSLLSGRLKGYRAVLPEKNSGVYEFVKYKVLGGIEPSGVDIMKNEIETAEAVKGKNNLIGFVSANSIQDSSEFTIYKIGRHETGMSGTEYLEPHPGYYVQELYPLTRLCVIYLTEINIGLASGFASYLTGNFGQKFVLDNKLGPAAVPVKVVR